MPSSFQEDEDKNTINEMDRRVEENQTKTTKLKTAYFQS